MKKIILFILINGIFLYCFANTGEQLDNLILKSNKIKHDGVQGFLFHHTPHDVIPDLPEKSAKYFTHSIWRSKYVPYQVYMNDLHEYDERINELEIQLAKVTTSLDNLTEHASSTNYALSLFTKLLEALAGLITVTGGIIGILKIKTKKKAS
jgi:hypothetical protein